MNVMQCSNTGFSLMIPSLAPKADVRDSGCYATVMRVGGQGGLAARMGQSNSSSLLCALVLITVIKCQNPYPRCFSGCPASSETSLPMGGRPGPRNALPGFTAVLTAGTARQEGKEGNCLALGHVQLLEDQESNSQVTLLTSDAMCIPFFAEDMSDEDELRTGGMFAPSGQKAGLEGLTTKVVLWEEFVAQKARFSLEYLVISFTPAALK